MKTIKAALMLLVLAVTIPAYGAQRSLLELAPNDTIAVIRMKDMSAQWKKFETTGAYQKLDHSVLMTKIRESQDFRDITDVLAVMEGGPVTPMELLLNFFGVDAVLSIVELPDNNSGGILVMRASSSDVLRRDIELLDSLDDKKAISPEDEILPYRDISILKRQREKKGKMETTYRVVTGDLIILSDNLELVKKTVDRHLDPSERGITADKRFKEAMARLPALANPITAYVDVKAIIAKIEAHLKSETQNKKLKPAYMLTAMMDSFDTVSAAVNFDDGAVITFSANAIQGAEMDKLLATFQTTGVIDAPAKLPAGTTVAFVAVRMDPKKLWDGLLSHFGENKTEKLRKLAIAANSFIGMADKSPEEGILEMLGANVCIAAIKQKSATTSPSTTEPAFSLPALVALMDYDGGREMSVRLDSIASAFFTVAAVTEGQKRHPSFRYETERFEGVMIHKIKLHRPAMKWLSPSLAIMDKFIVASSTVEGVKAVISTVKGKTPSLVSGKRIAPHAGEFRKPASGLLFLDISATADLLVRHKRLLLAGSKEVLSGAKTYEQARTEFDVFIDLLRIAESLGASTTLDKDGARRTVRLTVNNEQ